MAIDNQRSEGGVGRLPTVGETVLHFRLLQPLGEAEGDQDSFLAEDVNLGRRVCLRFIPSPYWRDPQMVSRFREDARKLAGLINPHLVPIHELLSYRDRPFVVAGCFTELTVADLIPEARRRPIPELGNLIMQVGWGLQAAHDVGLPHRQLAPGHVWLTPQHRVTLSGFQLGGPYNQAADTPDDESAVAYEYRAPEQLNGRGSDYRSDIFSFGVLMYEILTGEHPFRADTRERTVQAILEQTATPITDLRPGLPAQLDEVITRALQKRPDDRYQRIDRLLAAFTHAIAEVRLEDSREFLVSVINGLDDPVFVKDEQHRWVILNDIMCEMMGYPRHELIGKSDYDIFPKEQADVFWANDELVLRTGRTHVNEEEITWKGGTATISTKKSVLREPVSGRRFIVGTIRDITTYKEMDRELQERHHRYELAAHAGKVGVWDWNLLTDELYIDEHVPAGL
ncbi:protein kinase, partial [candidate division GN15 bacterium]|nr:protein kinase [candidate division GN15 bacterium]